MLFVCLVLEAAICPIPRSVRTVLSRLSFDEATGLLIAVQNFAWTDDQSSRIVEHYAYRAIDQAATLNDSDFDEKNSEYEFVER